MTNGNCRCSAKIKKELLEKSQVYLIKRHGAFDKKAKKVKKEHSHCLAHRPDSKVKCEKMRSRCFAMNFNFQFSQNISYGKSDKKERKKMASGGKV